MAKIVKKSEEKIVKKSVKVPGTIVEISIEQRESDGMWSVLRTRQLGVVTRESANFHKDNRELALGYMEDLWIETTRGRDAEIHRVDELTLHVLKSV